jgi:hypothetical protein
MANSESPNPGQARGSDLSLRDRPRNDRRLNFSSSTVRSWDRHGARESHITVPASITEHHPAITPDFSLSSISSTPSGMCSRKSPFSARPTDIHVRGTLSQQLEISGGVYTLNRFQTLRGGVGYDQPVVDRWAEILACRTRTASCCVGAGYNFSNARPSISDMRIISPPVTQIQIRREPIDP